MLSESKRSTWKVEFFTKDRKSGYFNFLWEAKILNTPQIQRTNFITSLLMCFIPQVESEHNMNTTQNKYYIWCLTPHWFFFFFRLRLSQFHNILWFSPIIHWISCLSRVGTNFPESMWWTDPSLLLWCSNRMGTSTSVRFILSPPAHNALSFVLDSSGWVGSRVQVPPLSPGWSWWWRWRGSGCWRRSCRCWRWCGWCCRPPSAPPRRCSSAPGVWTDLRAEWGGRGQRSDWW